MRFLVFALLAVPLSASAQIDRHALVTRHNPQLTKWSEVSPSQVGNGEFAFAMDLTGLQTFVPFNTMSQLGWHSGTPPTDLANYKGQTFTVQGRHIAYPMHDPNAPGASLWLASNPHKINLGRLSLLLTRRDGRHVLASDLKNVKQTLDLWSGVATSRFTFDGHPVTVKTAAHPKLEAVGVQVFSPLVREGRIRVAISAPGDDPRYLANYVGDWRQPSPLARVESSRQRAVFERKLGETVGYVSLNWEGDAEIAVATSQTTEAFHLVKAEYGAADRWVDVTDAVRAKIVGSRLAMRVDSSLAPDPFVGRAKFLRIGYIADGHEQRLQFAENEFIDLNAKPSPHRWVLSANGADSLSFTCQFRTRAVSPRPTPALFAASRANWANFWKSGAAIEFAGTPDPRAKELERRVVLSQYLMAVNAAGSYPPQESGLVNNSWYGKFHMEMVWWHGAHWALWNRWDRLRRYLGIYDEVLPMARQTAASQGYRGARWPKAIGPKSREWPHEIHAFLAWQQPHPIFFAELDYRAHPTTSTLKRWQPVVEATADFMASYAVLDSSTGRYNLAAPIHLVSENTNPHETLNPAFELSYWRFGLRVAQAWRERMKLAPNMQWKEVHDKLAPLPTQGGLYVLHELVTDMWTRFNYEHPALVGTYGMLPGDGVDRSVLAKTLAQIGDKWQFNRVWGWDFPMLAMAAARLNQPDTAVKFLLYDSPNFEFDDVGLASGGPFPYFPSNGGLLYAVGMMAAGWDGAPRRQVPGFPPSWKVKAEGFATAP